MRPTFLPMYKYVLLATLVAYGGCDNGGNAEPQQLYDPLTGDSIQVSGNDTVLITRSADWQYSRARSDARSTLAEFIDRFCHSPPGQTELGLKARFAEARPLNEKGDSIIENMWLSLLSVDKGVFRGTVENVPIDLKKVKHHDTVSVDISRVTDWYAVDNDTLVAGFTMRAYRSRMSAGNRAKYDSAQGFIVVPDSIEWLRRGLVGDQSAIRATLASRLTRSCS
jgi:uncharacterized protein YegJ (DUF2314 family)